MWGRTKVLVGWGGYLQWSSPLQDRVMYQSWMVEDSEKVFRGALLIGCIYLEGPLGFICWSDQSMPGLFYVFLCCSEWSLAGPFHQDFLREFQLVIDGLLYQQNPLQIRTRVLVGGGNRCGYPLLLIIQGFVVVGGWRMVKNISGVTPFQAVAASGAHLIFFNRQICLCLVLSIQLSWGNFNG